MPDPKTLRAEQCGPHRILRTSSSSGNRTLEWFDPACCGGSCFHFVRMVPCRPTSPDPACTIPPSNGTLYVCSRLPCMPPITGGWDSRPGGGIFHDGICWRFDAPVTRPEIPPGATIVEIGPVDCITCDDPRCGSFLYAQAEPCDPNYSGPIPLFCPAGLPFRCSTLNPSLYFSGQPNSCFRFRRDAPTQQYPPNTPVIYFPPNGPWIDGLTCCDCVSNCFRTGALPHLLRQPGEPGYQTFPGCCCGSVTNAVVLYSGSSYGEVVSQGFNGPFVAIREYFSWDGIGDNAGGLVNYTRRQVFLDPDGNVTADDTINYSLPGVGPSCPLARPHIINPAGAAEPSLPFDAFGGGTFFRSCTRLDVSWSGNFGMNPSSLPYGGAHAWNGSAVMIGMVAQPGCSNNCGDGTALATGSDNGTIRVRGGGSRPIDPAVAAWAAQHYGGCRTCGDPSPF